MSFPSPREESCSAKWSSNHRPDASLMKSKWNVNKWDSIDIDNTHTHIKKKKKLICIRIMTLFSYLGCWKSQHTQLLAYCWDEFVSWDWTKCFFTRLDRFNLVSVKLDKNDTALIPKMQRTSETRTSLIMDFQYSKTECIYHEPGLYFFKNLYLPSKTKSSSSAEMWED